MLKKIHHAFIPSQDNDHHPHLLRRNAVLVALAFVILFETSFVAQSFFVFRGKDFLASVLPGAISILTNEARAEEHIGSLRQNPLLVFAAQKNAEDMAERGYFSHISPDGKLPWRWLDQVGYNYQYAGQNLAVNFSDSSELVLAWLASPEHRENILKSQFTEIGIGMATGTYQGRETVFVVQFFASPANTKKQTVAVATDSVPAPPQGGGAGIPSSLATTPAVLGSTADTVLASDSGQPSFLSGVMTSPNTFIKRALFALLAFFVALIALSFFSFKRRSHPNALINGLTVIAVVLGIIIINQKLFIQTLQIPATGEQGATVVKAF